MLYIVFTVLCISSKSQINKTILILQIVLVLTLDLFRHFCLISGPQVILFADVLYYNSPGMFVLVRKVGRVVQIMMSLYPYYNVNIARQSSSHPVYISKYYSPPELCHSVWRQLSSCRHQIPKVGLQLKLDLKN